MLGHDGEGLGAEDQGPLVPAGGAPAEDPAAVVAAVECLLRAERAKAIGPHAIPGRYFADNGIDDAPHFQLFGGYFVVLQEG